MKAWIVLLLALTLPMTALAEEAAEGAAKVSYITMSPPFVGNYGLDGSAKMLPSWISSIGLSDVTSMTYSGSRKNSAALRRKA